MFGDLILSLRRRRCRECLCRRPGTGLSGSCRYGVFTRLRQIVPPVGRRPSRPRGPSAGDESSASSRAHAVLRNLSPRTSKDLRVQRFDGIGDRCASPRSAALMEPAIGDPETAIWPRMRARLRLRRGRRIGYWLTHPQWRRAETNCFARFSARIWRFSASAIRSASASAGRISRPTDSRTPPRVRSDCLGCNLVVASSQPPARLPLGACYQPLRVSHLSIIVPYVHHRPGIMTCQTFAPRTVMGSHMTSSGTHQNTTADPDSVSRPSDRRPLRSTSAGTSL